MARETEEGRKREGKEGRREEGKLHFDAKSHKCA